MGAGQGRTTLDQDENREGSTVFIGAVGLELLQQYRDAKTAEIGHEPDGWLLSYNGGRTEMRARSMTEYMARLAKEVGVPVYFHTLRHWAATELNRQGVDLPTAAGQLGRSIGVMAETYLHTSDDRGAAAGELIAASVGMAIESSVNSSPCKKIAAEAFRLAQPIMSHSEGSVDPWPARGCCARSS